MMQLHGGALLLVTTAVTRCSARHILNNIGYWYFHILPEINKVYNTDNYQLQ